MSLLSVETQRGYRDSAGDHAQQRQQLLDTLGMTPEEVRHIAIVMLVVFGILTLVSIVIFIISVIGMWRTFKKAGEPGWPALIPIYHTVVQLKISNKPIWWIVLYFIPVADIVMPFITSIATARAFGKGVVTGLLMPFGIGWLITGFGKCEFRGQKSF